MPGEGEEGAGKLLGLAVKLRATRQRCVRYLGAMVQGQGQVQGWRLGCTLETSEEAEMLKKAVLPREATARASNVLPVPGGPKSSTPFQAERHAAAAK